MQDRQCFIYDKLYWCACSKIAVDWHECSHSSMLFYANQNSLASRREDIAHVFSSILWILPPAPKSPSSTQIHGN